MQPGEQKLESDHHQNRAGGRKKTMKRYSQRALKKEKTDGHCDRDSKPGSNPDLHARAGKLHGTQDQNQLRTLPHHHQEYEESNSPAGGACGLLRVRLHPLLDVLL